MDKELSEAIEKRERLLQKWTDNVWYKVLVPWEIVKEYSKADTSRDEIPNWFERLDPDEPWYHIHSRAHDNAPLMAPDEWKGIFTEAEARAILWRENNRIRNLSGMHLVDYLRKLPDYSYLFIGRFYFIEVEIIFEGVG